MSAIERLLEALDSQIDAALIVSDANRFYFTGFPSSAGTLLITREQSYFIVDFRYIEIAKKTIQNCEVILQGNLTEQLNELLDRHQVRTLGIEAATLSLAAYQRFAGTLKTQVLADSRLSDAIEAIRAIKTKEEQDALRSAQIMTDRAFSFIINHIHPGVTEQDIILNMGAFMERLGSEGRSFDFIAISGPKTSLPHGKAGTRVIERGDFVTMDFGCKVNGYLSDMTRTVAVGEVSTHQAEVYEIVRQAQEKAFACIRPGAICNQVDAAARDYIASKGYGEYFGHGLGHSLGVEIHENPRFNQTCEYELRPGNVLTVEPGIYLPGQFGVRIEDMMLVTPDGYEDFTQSPKNLIIV